MRKNISRKSLGFTLIEIIVAIGILGYLITIGYGALSNILRSKQVLDDGRDARLTADAIVGRMTRELQLAFEGVALLAPRDNPTAAYASTICLVGTSDTVGDNAKSDSITFLALEGGQYLPDGGTHSGIVQISYKMVETPPDQSINGSVYSLVRDETPYIKPPKRAYRRSVIFPVSDRIRALEFRYYDGKKDEWVETWGDNLHENLPQAIWFSVTLESLGGKISKYATSIPLRE